MAWLLGKSLAHIVYSARDVQVLCVHVLVYQSISPGDRSAMDIYEELWVVSVYLFYDQCIDKPRYF